MVLSWLAGRLLAFAMKRMRAGDLSIVLALDAPEVTLTFPGKSSFSGVYRGKPAVRAWLERFCAIGMLIEPERVTATGPPWDTTLAAIVHVWLPDPAGGMVYDNRGVIWGHLRWGRLVRYEVFEDTLPAEAVDRWVAEHRPELAAPAA